MRQRQLHCCKSCRRVRVSRRPACRPVRLRARAASLINMLFNILCVHGRMHTSAPTPAQSSSPPRSLSCGVQRVGSAT
eukprot:15176159-Heterocapsa_arctica.AAC.1